MTAKSRLFQTNSGIFFYAEHNVNENGCPLHGQLLLFNLLFVRDNQSNEIPAEGKSQYGFFRQWMNSSPV